MPKSCTARLLVNAEGVLGVQDVRTILGTPDLLAVTSPLRVVDSVNPILDLHDEAAVLGDGTGELLVVVQTLSLLQSHGTVLTVARVELEGILVGKDIQSDTGPFGGKGSNGAFGLPVVVAEAATVSDVAGICTIVSHLCFLISSM